MNYAQFPCIEEIWIKRRDYNFHFSNYASYHTISHTYNGDYLNTLHRTVYLEWYKRTSWLCHNLLQIIESGLKQQWIVKIW